MQCPFCKEEILDGALKCKHCGSSLQAGEGLKNVLFPAEKGMKRNWKLRIGVAAFFFVFALLLFLPGGQGEIIFCEDVDENFNPVNESDIFTPGQISILVHSQNKLNSSVVVITLYEVQGEQHELMDRDRVQVNPEWDIFTYDLTLFSPGEYKVSVSRPEEETIAEGKVKVR